VVREAFGASVAATYSDAKWGELVMRISKVRLADTDKIITAILNGDNFTNSTGSFRGKGITTAWGIPAGFGSANRLDPEWLRRLRFDDPDYVIWSYDTPIAWHVVDDLMVGPEHWVMPDESYSVTTTRHQNLVRTALVFADVRTDLDTIDNDSKGGEYR
jgi:hypothetical protein